MKNLTGKIYVIAVALVLTGCIKRDYDLSGCYGNVNLRFDWAQAVERDTPETLEVVILDEAGETEGIRSPRGGTTLELLFGDYRFIAWEPASNVVVDGMTASLVLNGGNFAEPAYFAAGYVDDYIDPYLESQTVTVPMVRQTRRLEIRIEFTGPGVEQIRSADAVFTGVTFSRNIEDAFRNSPTAILPSALTNGIVDYNFTDTGEGYYTDVKNLLGLDGEARQYLNLDVVFNDDFRKEINYDLSSAVEDFHTYEVDKTMIVTIVINVGANHNNVYISEWKKTTGIELEAN